MWYLGHTLYLLDLIPFKLQHSQLVSLWKFSHCGYKRWYFTFYTCQINTSDIWLQFENSCHYHNTKKVLKSIFWAIEFFPKLWNINFFKNKNAFISIAIDFYASQLLTVKNEWFQTQMPIIQFLRFDSS